MGGSVAVFEVQLAQTDEGRYESLSFRLAQHPSETSDFLVTRALAYCLLYAPGIGLSAGICAGDEPPVHIQDDHGRRAVWIDVGRPPPERIGKATVACDQVWVVTWRDPREVWNHLERSVRKPERLTILGIDPDLVSGLGAALSRRNAWDLTVSGGSLYAQVGDEALQSILTRVDAGGVTEA